MNIESEKKRKSGYRKKYEKYLGVPIPKDFDVHHIDFNPLNNEVDNLVAMPRLIHQELHLLEYKKSDAAYQLHGCTTKKEVKAMFGKYSYMAVIYWQEKLKWDKNFKVANRNVITAKRYQERQLKNKRINNIFSNFQ